jgi:hypothetical protein
MRCGLVASSFELGTIASLGGLGSEAHCPVERKSAMKSLHIITVALIALGSPAAVAAPPEAAAPMAMPIAATDHSAHHSAQMHDMMGKADRAKTPAERSKLMAENMAMMKVHMAEMSAMMVHKPMVMPMPGGMTMDAAHMEKMAKHTAMVNQMMESLMVQQQLMMKSGK